MKSKLTPREIDLIWSDSILLADAMGLDLAPYGIEKEKYKEKKKGGRKQNGSTIRKNSRQKR
jgi:hypothetical protein